LRSKRTTGLSAEQFAELCRLVLAAVDWHAGCGRPRALTLGHAVKATVMYFKNNITQDVIAELLDVSQPTVSRIIAELEPVIGDVLDDYVPDPAEALTGLVTLIDGTLTPCWSWADAPELRSGKHHTTGHNHQVVTALDGRLLHVGDPLPGRVHDARAVRDTGLLDTLDVANSIGDKGYLGTGLFTPYRKPPGGELLDWQRTFNKEINSLRAPVERAISHLKTWRALHTDYRRPLRTYPTAFNTIRALHFFKLRFE
jgi:transposase